MSVQHLVFFFLLFISLILWAFTWCYILHCIRYIYILSSIDYAISHSHICSFQNPRFRYITTIQCNNNFQQIQQQHKYQEGLFAEKETAISEANSLREKLVAKETEIQRESKRRQKTHLELMDVRWVWQRVWGEGGRRVLVRLSQSVCELTREVSKWMCVWVNEGGRDEWANVGVRVWKCASKCELVSEWVSETMMIFIVVSASWFVIPIHWVGQEMEIIMKNYRFSMACTTTNTSSLHCSALFTKWHTNHNTHDYYRRNFDEKLRYEDKLGAELFQQKTEIADRDRQLSDAKATMDKYLRDYDALFARTQKVRKSYMPCFCVNEWCCPLLFFLCSHPVSAFEFCNYVFNRFALFLFIFYRIFRLFVFTLFFCVLGDWGFGASSYPQQRIPCRCHRFWERRKYDIFTFVSLLE